MMAPAAVTIVTRTIAGAERRNPTRAEVRTGVGVIDSPLIAGSAADGVGVGRGVGDGDDGESLIGGDELGPGVGAAGLGVGAALGGGEDGAGADP